MRKINHKHKLKLVVYYLINMTHTSSIFINIYDILAHLKFVFYLCFSINIIAFENNSWKRILLTLKNIFFINVFRVNIIAI